MIGLELVFKRSRYHALLDHRSPPTCIPRDRAYDIHGSGCILQQGEMELVVKKN